MALAQAGLRPNGCRCVQTRCQVWEFFEELGAAQEIAPCSRASEGACLRPQTKIICLYHSHLTAFPLILSALFDCGS